MTGGVQGVDAQHRLEDPRRQEHQRGVGNAKAERVNGLLPVGLVTRCAPSPAAARGTPSSLATARPRLFGDLALFFIDRGRHPRLLGTPSLIHRRPTAGPQEPCVMPGPSRLGRAQQAAARAVRARIRPALARRVLGRYISDQCSAGTYQTGARPVHIRPVLGRYISDRIRRVRLHRMLGASLRDSDEGLAAGGCGPRHSRNARRRWTRGGRTLLPSLVGGPRPFGGSRQRWQGRGAPPIREPRPATPGDPGRPGVTAPHLFNSRRSRKLEYAYCYL